MKNEKEKHYGNNRKSRGNIDTLNTITHMPDYSLTWVGTLDRLKNKLKNSMIILFCF